MQNRFLLYFVYVVDVGRSCILVTIGGKNIMLDCGMHMGFNDDVSFMSENELFKHIN
jgi:integrator complex subunit 11